MKNRAIYIFLYFLSFSAFGQDNLDSLLAEYESQPPDTSRLKTLNALFESYLYNDPDKAVEFGHEMLSLAKTLSDDDNIALAHNQLGSYHYVYDHTDSSTYYYTKARELYELLGDQVSVANVNHGLASVLYAATEYDSALTILDENVKIFSLLSDSLSLAITYDLIGSIQTFKGNYRIALNETLRALQIFEAHQNRIRAADALTHVAAIEFYLKNYQKSINYNSEALQIYKEENDTYFQAQAYNDIGNSLYYLGEYEEGIDSLRICVDMSRAQQIPELEATALNNIGKSLTAIGEYDSAIATLLYGLEIVNSGPNKNKQVEALLNLGEVYAKLGQYPRAIDYYDEAIQVAREIGSSSNLQTGYAKRSAAYEALRRYELALHDYQQYSRLSDTLMNEVKSRQIQEMRTIYETEKKEQQIALQEKEIDLLNQRSRNKTLQIILLAGGVVLLFVLIYGLRQRLHRNKLEREKLDAQLAFNQKQLTTHALHLARKNEVLESLKQQVEGLEPNREGLQKLIRTIDFDLRDDDNWEHFNRYFEQVHSNFHSRVKSRFPEVTPGELRLLALLKMNLSSKEIANILNISSEGIKKARYRLRKKLDLQSDASLQEAAMAL